jgi:hypothetical protein
VFKVRLDKVRIGTEKRNSLKFRLDKVRIATEKKKPT